MSVQMPTRPQLEYSLPTRPQLEYSLLCPLVCKYCSRRFQYPFDNFWKHVKHHECKYKRFWFGSDRSVFGKRKRRHLTGRKPTVNNSPGRPNGCKKAVTKQQSERKATNEASHNELDSRNIFDTYGELIANGEESDTNHRTVTQCGLNSEQAKHYKAADASISSRTATNKNNDSVSKQYRTTNKVNSSKRRSNKLKTNGNVLSKTSAHTYKSQHTKLLTLRPKVCKYCQRRFYHRFWHYRRHLRSHERRYKKFWFSVTNRQRNRSSHSIENMSNNQQNSIDQVDRHNEEKDLPQIKEELMSDQESENTSTEANTFETNMEIKQEQISDDDSSSSRDCHKETVSIGDLLTQRIENPDSDASYVDDNLTDINSNTLPRGKTKQSSTCQTTTQREARVTCGNDRDDNVQQDLSSGNYVEQTGENDFKIQKSLCKEGLSIRLVKMRIDDKQMWTVSSSSDSTESNNVTEKILHQKRGRGRPRKRPHPNMSEHKQLTVNPVQETQTDKTLGSRKLAVSRRRPKTGYYSRLTKGLEDVGKNSHQKMRTTQNDVGENLHMQSTPLNKFGTRWSLRVQPQNKEKEFSYGVTHQRSTIKSCFQKKGNILEKRSYKRKTNNTMKSKTLNKSRSTNKRVAIATSSCLPGRKNKNKQEPQNSMKQKSSNRDTTKDVSKSAHANLTSEDTNRSSAKVNGSAHDTEDVRKFVDSPRAKSKRKNSGSACDDNGKIIDKNHSSAKANDFVKSASKLTLPTVPEPSRDESGNRLSRQEKTKTFGKDNDLDSSNKNDLSRGNSKKHAVRTSKAKTTNTESKRSTNSNGMSETIPLEKFATRWSLRGTTKKTKPHEPSANRNLTDSNKSDEEQEYNQNKAKSGNSRSLKTKANSKNMELQNQKSKNNDREKDNSNGAEEKQQRKSAILGSRGDSADNIQAGKNRSSQHMQTQRGNNRKPNNSVEDNEDDWDDVSIGDTDHSSDKSYKCDESDSEDDEDSDSDNAVKHNFTRPSKQKIIVRVKPELDSSDDDLDESRSSISSVTLKNPPENCSKKKQSIVRVDELSDKADLSKQYPEKEASEITNSPGNRSEKENPKQVHVLKKYFDNIVRDKDPKPTVYLTNMKRLTPEEHQAYLKKKEKKYSLNIPLFKTKRRPFGCTICGKHYAFKSYLNYHMLCHTLPKKYECNVCGKAFQRKTKLRDHTNTHTGTIAFRCTICGKGFTDSRNIRSHERTHTGEKPYSCQFCPKTFRMQGELVSHVRYHTGERPYKCPEPDCGKAFHTSGHLSRHRKIHTGEIKYKPSQPRSKTHACPYCGKLFPSQGAVTKHTISHTKEKPYPCSICGRGFGYKSHRNRHEMTVHSDLRPFKCTKCGKGFKDDSSRKVHEKYIHAFDDMSSDESIPDTAGKHLQKPDPQSLKTKHTQDKENAIELMQKVTQPQNSDMRKEKQRFTSAWIDDFPDTIDEQEFENDKQSNAKRTTSRHAEKNQDTTVIRKPSSEIIVSRKSKNMPKLQPALLEYSSGNEPTNNSYDVSHIKQSSKTHFKKKKEKSVSHSHGEVPDLQPAFDIEEQGPNASHKKSSHTKTHGKTSTHDQNVKEKTITHSQKCDDLPDLQSIEEPNPVTNSRKTGGRANVSSRRNKYGMEKTVSRSHDDEIPDLEPALDYYPQNRHFDGYESSPRRRTAASDVHYQSDSNRSVRSVFDNFVSKTNVNIVVKHTCGKEYQETITSSHLSNYSTTEQRDMFSSSEHIPRDLLPSAAGHPRGLYSSSEHHPRDLLPLPERYPHDLLSSSEHHPPRNIYPSSERNSRDLSPSFERYRSGLYSSSEHPRRDFHQPSERHQRDMYSSSERHQRDLYSSSERHLPHDHNSSPQQISRPSGDLFSSLRSRLDASLSEAESYLQVEGSEVENDDHASPNLFHGRNTSRCSSVSRDFKTTLSRLESIQRNAKMIADVLRRNRRGKIPLPKHRQKPADEDRLSSFETLMSSLESASDGQWSKPVPIAKQNTQPIVVARARAVNPPKRLWPPENHEETSSVNSFSSEDDEPPALTQQVDESAKPQVTKSAKPYKIPLIKSTKSRTAESVKSNKPRVTATESSTKSNKNRSNQQFKDRHKDKLTSEQVKKLTPEMQRVLGRQRREKKGKQFRCTQCPKTYLNRSSLTMHKRVHDLGKQHVCRFCKKAFALPSGLSRHLRTHTGEKKWKCRFCQKGFAERYSVQCHERIHTGEKPYKCLECGMKFVDCGSLTKHAKCHSADRPYKCTQCDAAYKWSAMLKRHEREVHSQVKHECVFCGIQYTRRESLFAHERRMHSGSKPYLCQDCGMRFAERQKYKLHIQKHEGTLPQST